MPTNSSISEYHMAALVPHDARTYLNKAITSNHMQSTLSGGPGLWPESKSDHIF